VLLDQVQEADCGFDAVVVGEFERAFTDRQFHEVCALLAVHGVAVWLPEVGGPVDLADPDHRVLMQVLAAQSQREVVRSLYEWFRVGSLRIPVNLRVDPRAKKLVAGGPILAAAIQWPTRRRKS